MSHELTTQTSSKLPTTAASRAVAISASLRRAARQSRVPVSIVSGGGGFRARRIDRLIIRFVAVTFVLCFFLPTTLGGIYFFLIASDKYQSEVRFVVRNGQKSPLDSLASISALGQSGQYKDALILKNYIESSAIASTLDTMLNLRGRYSDQSKIDFLSRLPSDASAEKFYDYWENRVDVYVDNRSGAVVVKVDAFAAEDAYEINKAIIGLSEKLINELSDRSERDALVNARKELDSAKSNLENVISRFLSVRNKLGVVDADAAAEATTALVVGIRTQLVQLRQRRDLLAASLTPGALQLRMLDTQISSLEQQLKNVDGSLGDSSPTDVTVADAKREFDQVTIQQQVARETYASAFVAYESARSQIGVTKIYLEVFEGPSKPEIALYPKRATWWIIITVAGLAVWGALFGLAILIRDHWAR